MAAKIENRASVSQEKGKEMANTGLTSSKDRPPHPDPPEKKEAPSAPAQPVNPAPNAQPTPNYTGVSGSPSGERLLRLRGEPEYLGLIQAGTPLAIVDHYTVAPAKSAQLIIGVARQVEEHIVLTQVGGICRSKCATGDDEPRPGMPVSINEDGLLTVGTDGPAICLAAQNGNCDFLIG